MAHTHHDHAGHHHHHEMPDHVNFAFIVSIAANLIYTIIQFVFAILANSSSLLADAGHNLGDVLSLIFAWIGSSLLKSKPSPKRTYGLKKSSIIAAMTNAVILIFTCGIIFVEAVKTIFYPEPIHTTIVMVVAAIGIVVNGSTALLFQNGSQDDLNLRGAFLHLAFDALVSLGVVVAGFLIYLTGWRYFDPIMAFIIIGIIFWSSWGLLRDSLNLMVDGVPKNINCDEVRASLLKLTGATEVHDLHIWALSTQDVALTAHLVIAQAMDPQKRQTLDQALKDQFKINHITLQTECGASPYDCNHCH